MQRLVARTGTESHRAPVPIEHDGNRPPHDFQIQPQGPVVNVFQIQPHPVAEIGDVVAAADLPEAGEAGFDAQAAAMRQIVKTFDFVHRQRARADEAHLAAQDVKELGKFINAEFAEEFADGRDARDRSSS